MTLRGCTCQRPDRRWQSDGPCLTCGQHPLESQLIPVLLQILTGGTGLILFRNAAGYDDRRKVRYGLAPGSGDFIGLYQGRYVEIEFKTLKGRQSADQQSHQALVERCGGFYALVRSSEDALQVLQLLRGGGSHPTTTAANQP